jgi:hypothetical protein
MSTSAPWMLVVSFPPSKLGFFLVCTDLIQVGSAYETAMDTAGCRLAPCICRETVTESEGSASKEVEPFRRLVHLLSRVA